MTSTPATDQIILQRITGERTPRFYHMTGGPFDAMLAAVKALPFSRFESTSISRST